MAKRKLSAFERLERGERLSRKERREGQQRLNLDDPSLDIIHRDAAGIDVGNESHFVSVPPTATRRPYASWVVDRRAGRDGAVAQELSNPVVMQSTGVYWIALHAVLQRHGLEVNLVDARGTKNVPGRKSDVQECQWLRKLHTYGLLRSCFLPPPEIHAVRTLWRLRSQHVREPGGASSRCKRP
jgi:transposase